MHGMSNESVFLSIIVHVHQLRSLNCCTVSLCYVSMPQTDKLAWESLPLKV